MKILDVCCGSRVFLILHLYGWEMDFRPGQKPLSAYYWHIGESEPTFHEYKHVDGILKHAKKNV